MATWFRIEFEGEPTESDFERVAAAAAQGFTSGQLINDRDVDEAANELRPWQHGHAADAVLFAEILFAGDARLDAMSYDGKDPAAALEAVRAAPAAGIITEAYVHYPDGTVALDIKAVQS